MTNTIGADDVPSRLQLKRSKQVVTYLPTAPAVQGGGNARAATVLRIVIAAPSRIHLYGLRHLLSAVDAFAVVGSATTSAGAVAALSLAGLGTTVVVDLSTGEGLSLTREMHRAAPDATLVGLTASKSDATVLEAIEAGAAAVIGPEAGLGELVATARAARAGELGCFPSTAAALRRRVWALSRALATEPPPHLTARELEIMSLVAGGASNRDISARLCIELSTVKNHLHNIFEKLHVSTREEAADHLRRNGLLGVVPDEAEIACHTRQSGQRGSRTPWSGR